MDQAEQEVQKLESMAAKLREACENGASTSDVMQMLADAQAAEREACAQICDEHTDFYNNCALAHPNDSEERARCFARARASRNNATGIRTRTTL